MAKGKRELLSKAPWRGDDADEETNKFKDAKLKVTNQPGSTPTMHVPRKKNRNPADDDDEDDLLELDPELRYSFQRNFQFLQRVFSIDTVVKPLPPAMQYNVSRNLSFFTRIFTQFFDPEGIANAQKSLGLGQEEKDRRVR
ncbi:uncharacterized protein LOC8263230 [Ricinus communis]|uniref:Uncharacterized protein n=1 Tax=Ricinus communis TaxID=3988 RepID=B9SK83_RICCO|nr:uncharacterized protein LOC8263230 [Ricinus communis]EEF35978.1 conserved hypothetical protein [Ricinus communis]|eukprot:XP_002526402.1 uncharacterized protein LOC8263230 [Ricinus communis]